MSTERDSGLTWRAPRERNEQQGRYEQQGRNERQGRRREPVELTDEQIRDRLRRRAAFLRELAEARELRRRVTPRRSRRAQAKAALRKNTFRAP